MSSLPPEIQAVLAGESRGCVVVGDCLPIMSAMPDGCVDAVVTDPPYNVEFAGKTTKHTRATHEYGGGYDSGDSNIGPRGVSAALRLAVRAVVFPGLRMMFQYPSPYDIGCVYCPSGAGLGRWGFVVMHPILFYGVGLPHTRQGPSGFQSFDTQPANGHPCPKPVPWMEWAVKKCSTTSQIILDPFCGSGTTCVAAKKLGRRYIGIDISEKYVAIAKARLAATPEPMFVPEQAKPQQLQLIGADDD